MRNPVLALIFLFLLPLFHGSVSAGESPFSETEPQKQFYLNELGFGTGYAWGHSSVNGDFFDVYPVYVRIGYDMSRVIGLSGNRTRLQLSFDPFVNAINTQERGVEVGLNVFMRYFVPLLGGLDAFGEIGSGPAYLSIYSEEQHDPDFSFLSHFGAGFQLKLSDRIAFHAAYRKRHLSNAGFRDPNHPFDTWGYAGGLSILY